MSPPWVRDLAPDQLFLKRIHNPRASICWMLCNGEILHQDLDEAIKYLNDIAEKAHTWTEPSVTNSTNRSRLVGIYHLKEEDNLKAQIEALTRQVEALKSKDGRGIHLDARVMCGRVEHRLQDCRPMVK